METHTNRAESTGTVNLLEIDRSNPMNEQIHTTRSQNRAS